MKKQLFVSVFCFIIFAVGVLAFNANSVLPLSLTFGNKNTMSQTLQAEEAANAVGFLNAKNQQTAINSTLSKNQNSINFNVANQNAGIDKTQSEFTIIDDKKFYLGGKAIENESKDKIALTEANYLTPMPSITLPKAYNMTEDYMLTVENQGSMGLCWAFSCNKVLENFVSRNFGDFFNFSETWLATANRAVESNYLIGSGGHHIYYMNAVNAHGLVLDNVLPYEYVYNIGNSNYANYISSYASSATKSLVSNINYEQLSFTTVVDNSAYQNFIKSYLIQFGAMSASINADTFNINTDGSYYLPVSTSPTINHAVTLIGFNDNYVINDATGKHTGAWLCQNSWAGDYTYFWVSYQDFNFRSQLAYISSITYNGYKYDFSKTSQQNFNSYSAQNFYLENSNTNYTNFNFSQQTIEENFTKDIFNYTEQTNFYNSLTYKYPENFSTDAISAQIILNGQDVTTNFYLTQNYNLKTFNVKSKKSGLAPGTYNAKFFIDTNLDGVADKTYLKSFVVYSGAEIGTALTLDLNNNKYFNLVATNNSGKNVLSSYVTDIYGFGKSLYLSLEFGNYSKITNYNVANFDTSVYDLGSGDNLTAATASSYASGNLALCLALKIGGTLPTNQFVATITFTTIEGYEFVYHWYCMPHTAAQPTYVCVDYQTNGGGFDVEPFYLNAINSSSLGNIYDKIYLKNPTKANHIFKGWFKNSIFTMPISKDAEGYYLSYSNFSAAGSNFYNAAGSITVASAMVFAKFEPLCANINSVANGTAIEANFVDDQNTNLSNARVDEITINENQTSVTKKVQLFDVSINNGFKADYFIINDKKYNIGHDVIEYDTSVISPLENISANNTPKNNAIESQKFLQQNPAKTTSTGSTKTFYYVGTDLIQSIAVSTTNIQLQLNVSASAGGTAGIGLTLGQEVQSSVTVANNTTNAAYLKATANDGFDFKNWLITTGDTFIEISNLNTAQAAVNTLTGGGNEDVLNETSIIITAVFEEQNYEISYLGIEGIDAELLQSLPQTYNLKKGTLYLPNLTKPDNLFLGWTYTCNGNSSQTPTRSLSLEVGLETGKINGNLQLTANWKQNGYILSYSSNGGSGSWEETFVSSDDIIELKGQATTNPSTGEITGIYKPSNSLNGWLLTAINSSGSIVTEMELPLNSTYSVSDLLAFIEASSSALSAGDNIVLSAIWQEFSYNVIFNAGAIGSYTLSGISQGELTKSLKASSTFYLFKNEFIKTGYQILQWNIIGVDGVAISLRAGETKTVQNIAAEAGLETNNANLTLIAVWSAIPYTLSFNFSNPNDQSQTFPQIFYNIETSSVALPNANNLPDGFHIIWKSQANGECEFWNNSTFEFGVLTLPAGSAYGNLTLVGEIVANTYKISYLANGAQVLDETALTNLNSKIITYSNNPAQLFEFATTSQLNAIFAMENYSILGFEINGMQMLNNVEISVFNMVLAAGVETQNNATIQIKVLWKADSFSVDYYLLKRISGSDTYEKITDSSILANLKTLYKYDETTILNNLQPTEPGKDFSGWHLYNSSQIITTLEAFAYTENIKLYGEFKTRILTISFYNDIGEKYENEAKIEFGKTYDINFFKPQKSSSISTDFAFAGWFDGIASTASEITNFVIFENQNFYAHFAQSPRKYAISFYDYQSQLLQTVDVEYNTDALNFFIGATPTKPKTNTNSFDFLGWHTNNAATTPLSEFNVLGSASLYPVFLPVEIKYTLQLLDEDKTTLLISPVSEFSYETEVNLTQNAFVPNTSSKNTAQYSFTFLGWFNEQDITNDFGETLDLSKKITSLTITQDTKLYAQFSRSLNNYSINLFYKEFSDSQSHPYSVYFDGENYVSSFNRFYDEVFNVLSLGQNFEFPLPEEGYDYTFKGWFGLENATITDAPLSTFNVLENTNIYALFEKQKIQITYSFWNEEGTEKEKINNVEISDKTEQHGTEAISIIQSVPGESVVYIDKFNLGQRQTTKYDLTFIGWFLKPMAESDGTELPITNLNFTTTQKSVKLYGWFQKTLRSYELKFYDANGREIQVPAGSNTFQFGATVDVAEIITELPTKQQTAQQTFLFEAWFTDVELTEESKLKNNQIVLTEEILSGKQTLKLYPKFTASPRVYSVMFYKELSNDLLFETSGDFGTFVNYLGILPIKEPTNVYSFEFIGWISDADSSNLQNMIEKGEEIPVRAVTSQTTQDENTYRPVFKSVLIPYVLTLKTGDETIEQITYKYNDAINLLSEDFKITKEPTDGIKYTFVGWSKNQTADPEDSKQILSSLNITANTTLYAIFKLTPYVSLDENAVGTILIICGVGVGIILLSVVTTVLIKRNSGMNNSRKTNNKIQEIRAKQELLRREREEIERRINDRKKK